MASKKNIYLIHGTDSFLVKEAFLKLKEKLNFLEFENIEAEKLSFFELREKIESQSLFSLSSQKRILVIKNSSLFIPKQSKIEDVNKEKKKQDDESLIDLLKINEADTTLIFIVLESLDTNSPKKIDKRKKLYNFFKKEANIIEVKDFSSYNDQDLLNWLKEKVKLAKKNIDNDALKTLIEIAGRNPAILFQELQKFFSYIGNKDIISKDDVIEMASAGKVASFALVNALRDKKIEAALLALQKSIYYKENVFSLLMSIASQFRMMLKIAFLKDQKLSYQEILQKIENRSFSYYFDISYKSTKNFSKLDLIRIFKNISEVDYYFKSGLISKEYALEQLVIDICS